MLGHSSPIPSDPPGDAGQDFELLAVSQADRALALARVMNAGPPDADAVRDLVGRLEADGNDLSLLWATRRIPSGGTAAQPGRRDPSPFTQACLAILGAGRTAVVLVSPGLPSEHLGRGMHARARRERAALLTRASNDLQSLNRDQNRVVLAQTLLEPDAHDLITAFEDAGFRRLADLGYLRRSIPSPHRAGARPSRLPPGIRVATLADIDPQYQRAVLAQVLEKTYVGTLDCPDLCGLRSVDDVIDSHRAVGVFDPSLWLLVLQDHPADPVSGSRLRGSPEGCMLLSAGSAPDTVELVYLGLSPALRGRGVGDELIAAGLARLAGRPESTIACAVDLANGPALSLYRRAGFKRFTERVALVREIPGAPTA